MAAEESLVHLLDLFDDLWFQNKHYNQPIIVSESNVDVDELQPKLARISTSADNDEKMMMNTSQESLMSSTSSGGSDDLLSPNSVLTRSPVKLQTIFSGKQSVEYPEDEEEKSPEKQQVKKIIHTRGKKRKGKGVSTKSLSELEFEELKGFMDLGFVFSERDKNSKLVDIIPGLQRLGKEEEEEDKQENKNANAPAATLKRPYLSQAWEAMEFGRKSSQPEKLKYLKINAQVVDNEMVMKHQLKFWAQTVASAVK